MLLLAHFVIILKFDFEDRFRDTVHCCSRFSVLQVGEVEQRKGKRFFCHVCVLIFRPKKERRSRHLIISGCLEKRQLYHK